MRRFLLLFLLVFLAGCAKTADLSEGQDIRSGLLRDTVFSLVSSAENSSTDYRAQYSYLEDIGDGRGYTAGIIGFTSGTGDLLDVMRLYEELKPENNALSPYIPALEAVNGTDSHEGLGENFEMAWVAACEDEEMIEAQNRILEEQYLTPAVASAKVDGLSPLGQYIYYDALVVHEPGEDGDSFGGIRTAALKNAKPPAKGGGETTYLLVFLDAREVVMLKEEAHSDLSRLTTQREFLSDENFFLDRPLTWTMYGERFTLK